MKKCNKFIQGDWSSQFKAEETALGNFYVKRDQIRTVKFMNQEGAFNYYTSEELQAHVVELPYQVVKKQMAIQGDLYFSVPGRPRLHGCHPSPLP